MTTQDYKESIKKLVDATDNEVLLKHWKKQLEHDILHKKEIEMTTDEWNLVQEGITDYNNGATLSLEEFISKRK